MGRNFKIVQLPAGNYHWRHIQTERGVRHWSCNFPEDDVVSITANAINYIGDLTVNLDGYVCRWRFRDHGIETSQYMRKWYPILMRSHEFVSSLTSSTVGRTIPDSVLEAGELRPVPSARAVVTKVLTDTAGFRDQLCACADKACADRVSHAMARWTREFGLDESSPELTADEQAQLNATTKALNECREAAARGSHPPPSSVPGSVSP